jgi:hypothetical protein
MQLGLGQNWGATPEERSRAFPCDRIGWAPDAAFHRAITVRAGADLVFRWLCQLRVAPYSYDWLDNLGRRSPRHLTPGLERLERGQTFMTIFQLEAFEPGRSLTIVNRTSGGGRPVFGEVRVSYVVVPSSSDACRLVVKLLVRYPRPPVGWLVRAVLPVGDLVMMRRQLLTLRRLAERDWAAARGIAPGQDAHAARAGPERRRTGRASLRTRPTRGPGSS